MSDSLKDSGASAAEGFLVEKALTTGVDKQLAASEVFRLHGKDVTRWASRLDPTLDLEDVVQEVFLTVHRNLGGWKEGRGALTTWLYRITENEVRHRRRREKWRRWLGGSAEDVAGEVPAESVRPDEALERRQGHTRFYRVLDTMKERYRTVLVLFELEGLSGEEIARLLDARPATVFVWLHRARADFLARMERLLREEGA